MTSLYRSLAFPSADRSLITALLFNLNVMKSPPLLLRPSFYLPPLRSFVRSFGARNNRNRTIASKREEEEEEKKFDRPSVESRNFFVYFVVLYRPRYLSSLFPSPLPLRDRGFRRDARAKGQTIIVSLRVIDRARSCDTLRETCPTYP